MDNLPEIVSSSWSLVRLAVSFGMLVYIVFAIVVVRQVKLMTETLEIDFETPIKIISWLHLFFAILVLIFAIFS